MADGKIEFDDLLFCKRLKKLYEAWQGKPDLWQGATALIVAAGASSDELRYLKSGALQLWLFAYELPDTVFGFTQDSLHVLTSAKKVKYLEPLVKAAEDQAGIKMHFLVKSKGEDGQAQAQELLQALQQGESPAVIGHLPKDSHDGAFAKMFLQVQSSADPELNLVDISGGVSDLLACKDPEEIKKAKKAAFLAASALQKFAVPQFESIIDEEVKTNHSKLSQKIEEVITQPEKSLQIRLRPENCDIAYPPIVQSGGEYSLKLSVQSTATPLKYDVILCGIGARYSMYCANVARTVLVDPNKQQEEEYKALLAAQEAAIAALVEGASLAAPVEAATQALKDKGQGQLVEKLPKTLGFGMGLEFREASLLLSSKSQNVVKAGMIFNVSVGAQDLKRSDPNEGQAEIYALQIADTVIVQPGAAAPEVVTGTATKSWADIAYYFKDEEEDSKPEAPPTPKANAASKETKLRSKNDNFKAQDEQRQRQRENQEDLLTRANEETRRNLQRKKGDADEGDGPGRKVSDTCAYRSVSDMPAPRDLAIQVDQRTESVLLPIYGIMVPFHILTIKNATNNQDGDHAYIRINFNFGTSYEPTAKFPNALFLKELSFRSSDPKRASKVVQEIKMLRGSITQREKEKSERATLVQQERLIKSGGRVVALQDVWIRPTLVSKGRKMTGTLEAHQNGFRYSSPKGETLDVMYRNIKHAFFQPADKELLTLVHFRLRNPIMVGKKKTDDVQFYTEVGEAVQTLDGGRRSMYDPDEIEEEQRERDVRNKINKQFQKYVKFVTAEIWEKHFSTLGLEFEVPYRSLGFHGVPHKTTSFIMPTVNCLVELVDVPSTVVTMADVGIVNLERVGFSLRNFDMTLVYKDLTRDVMRIDAIPSSSLDDLKDWLSSVNIKFYESKINLNWKPILKNIIEDPDAFFENGGWSFLDQEGGSDDEDAEEEDEADPEFQGSEEESEESEDESSSEDESVVDSDEADEDDEDFSEEEDEEGKDWEELEEEAKQADKVKQSDSDDETDRKRKRKGGSAAATQKRGRR